MNTKKINEFISKVYDNGLKVLERNKLTPFQYDCILVCYDELLKTGKSICCWKPVVEFFTKRGCKAELDEQGYNYLIRV